MKLEKIKRKIVNHKMAEIIRTLHQKGGAMSTHEIAKESGLSYITVRKYIKELENLEIVFEPIQKREGAIIAIIKKRKGKRSRTKRYTLNYKIIFSDKNHFMNK